MVLVEANGAPAGPAQHLTDLAALALQKGLRRAGIELVDVAAVRANPLARASCPGRLLEGEYLDPSLSWEQCLPYADWKPTARRVTEGLGVDVPVGAMLWIGAVDENSFRVTHLIVSDLTRHSAVSVEFGCPHSDLAGVPAFNLGNDEEVETAITDAASIAGMQWLHGNHER
jgi:hypothetical protein